MDSLVNFTKHLRRMNTNPSLTHSKIKEETLPNSVYELLLTEVRQRNHKTKDQYSLEI